MAKKELIVKVDLPQPARNCIKYVWIIFCDYFKIHPQFSRDRFSLKISQSDDADIRISKQFTEMINKEQYHHDEVFVSEPMLKCEDGRPDYLGTCFYMLNYLQEYHPSDDQVDLYGRFSYYHSYQCRFSCSDKDLVSRFFLKLRNNIPELSHIQPIYKPSRLFLSHDIDTIYSSLFEETKAALKQKNLKLMLNVMTKHVLEGPSYLNMDRIMDMHDEYDFRSTFFWLVRKGKKRSRYSRKSIPHADYSVKDHRIRSIIHKIRKRGFENGLHKSAFQSKPDTELKMMEEEILGNRNHYLLVRTPDHFDECEKSNLLLDFSLGFYRMYGHRNSYARPVVPYSMKKSEAYSFLEVPLQIMDKTFKRYQNLTVKKAENLIIDFLDAHRKNAVISILWHNDMFSPIKNPGWLKLYKMLLDYAHQHGLSSITQEDLLVDRERMVNCFRSNSL
jgi:peptidoglycan/xylan/chitin deacetylase (PgdA/CDA1 family)